MNAGFAQIIVKAHQQDLQVAAARQRLASGGREVRLESSTFVTTR